MDVDYGHYLAPDDPTDKPDAEQIDRLVHALHDGGDVIGADTRDFTGKTFFG